MEKLRFGWRASSRSGTYHYVPDFTGRYTDQLKSLCLKLTMDRFYAKDKEFLEKFEILDTSQICHVCELKLQQRNQNNFKKEILTEINQTNIQDTFTLQQFVCSEESCNNSGAAFVSVSNPKEEHYCIIYNLRVQETIKKLEVTP